jgi:hypothetical protein
VSPPRLLERGAGGPTPSAQVQLPGEEEIDASPDAEFDAPSIFEGGLYDAAILDVPVITDAAALEAAADAEDADGGEP